MASLDVMGRWGPLSNQAPIWTYVAFTSGSVEPSKGDTIRGRTSGANAVLEYIELTSGTWVGTDAAGFMLLSNHNGTAWSTGETFAANDSGGPDEGTLTATPVDAFASLDTLNHAPVLDFDATVNEVAMFQGVLPQNYDGGGLTLTLGVITTTITGDMSFYAFIKSIGDSTENLGTAGTDPSTLKVFAEPQKNEAIDAPSTVGFVRYFTITFSNGAQMDSLAAGELFYLMIMRNAQDTTNDDMAADASIVFAELRET
jgi:hypothetical protein